MIKVMAGFQQNSTSISIAEISSINSTYLSNNELQRQTMNDMLTDDIIFVTECLLFPIISVVGLIGNVISIAVLLNRKMRTSTSFSLAALAVSNSLLLIANTLWKSSCIIKCFDVILYYKYYAYGFSVLFYLTTSCSRISSWLIVIIASEKMVVVTFPLKFKAYCTGKNTSVLEVIISVITFLFLLPLCLKFTVGYVYDQRLQAIRAYLKETEYYIENKDLFDNYVKYFLDIAFRYVPMALLIIVNTKLWITLWKKRSYRQKTYPNNRNLVRSWKEHRILIVSVTVVTVFIICLLPGNIHVAVEMVVEEYNKYGMYHNIYIVMDNISLLLEVVNSSLIFFIYMMTNKKFVQMFKGIFCRCAAKLRATVSRANSPEVTLLEIQPRSRKYRHMRCKVWLRQRQQLHCM